MRCSKCGSDNREGRKFCAGCGAPLITSCPKCGAPNQPGERFCGECGTALGEVTPAAVADTPPATVSAGGERRHLTVLFCDLVGSTEIAARLDPEEWREIVASYHRAATLAITQFGGYVAHYLGDGVMAYFGWPEAHDNNAERAARAGLAILDAIPKVNVQPRRPKLSARVGIDSGAVVVAASGSKNADVFGDTPNIAARVQAAALPNTVLITADTQRLISGMFVVEDCGAPMLKGIERQIQLYRVIHPSGVRGQLEAAAAAHGLTPFIGRDDELRLLMSRWESAIAGEGHIVLISGEAGIGKSRLLQRFHEQIAGRRFNWIQAAAGPFFQNTPFYPVAEILRQLPTQRDTRPDRLNVAIEHERKRRTFAVLEGSNGHPVNGASIKTYGQHEKSASSRELDEKLKPTRQLAVALLNLLNPMEHPLSLPQRRLLLSSLVEWVLGAARVVPLAIAIEDLHWADPSTLELIQLLVEQAATAPLLLLCTARPELRAKWPPRAHLTQITLSTLSAHQTRMMVEQVAAQKTLTEETVATVIERTGGVPLFIEELTRAVLESGDLKLASREIPATLHDSLMARLDRVGPAKEVIQIGAVIGSEFSYALLHAVHPIAEEALQNALSRLIDAQLLYIRGVDLDATYQFKHSLIRDAAYEALLKSRRKELHRLVARSINEKFPEIREAQAEVLARHWTEADETEPAIAEWSRAGSAAEARGAFKEALESYQRALALLNSLPESPQRHFRELEYRLLIVQTLRITRGYSAPETIEATESAAGLAERSGNLEQLVKWMIARGLSAYISGELNAAGALLDRTLELAVRQNSAISLGSTYALQVETHYSRGDLVGAENYFTAGLQFFKDPGSERVSVEAAVAAFGAASLTAWLLGRPAVARDRIAEMMAVTTANDWYNLALSAAFAAQIHIFLRQYAQAESFAIQAIELSGKHQFPYFAALSRCVLGHARAQLGHPGDGIALIREGLDSLVKIGSRLGLGNFTAWLAAAQVHEGAIADALETLEQALQANADELVYRPETLRMRGEMRIRQGQAEIAETDLRDSVALAQKMGAKSWELRAATSLFRLLAKQRRRDEAHAMLADIYGWFTEGFDTADLKDAKALLDELSR